MNKYENGKIYKLVDENDWWYIGSTIVSLKKRLINHTNGNMNCSSSIMINPQIELIEEYPCSNVMELRMREQHYLAKYRDKCINKQNAYSTKELHKEQTKEWRKNNKEHMRKYEKDYREKNGINENVKCECGSIVTKGKLNRHKQTKKHINFLQNKEQIVECECGFVTTNKDRDWETICS